MKKLVSFAAILMLTACAGGSLFDGPECNCHKKAVAQRPCPQQVIYAQPVVQKTPRLVDVVYFANGSDHLTEAEKAELKRIAQYAQTYGTPVKIMGHASHKVDARALSKKDAINMDISKKRTQKVADTLVAMGVDARLITAMAYSDTRPAEVEVDAKTEALNRRVEIYLEY